MPQGGGSTSASSNQETAGIAGKEIFKLVREGVSWSGHERNSCFLSSGTSGRFLNISEASGFAFPDDGRAMILTDWDGDGDLDSFISNRNAPQVRFLRNDIPQINKNWISLRLKGSGMVNKDAIGARVTLIMDNQPPISRTLRAGHGFQAQASKELHFGLGSNASINKVLIRWPNGEEIEYESIEVDKSYNITYGTKKLQPFFKQPSKWPSPLPKLESNVTSSEVSVSLNSKIPAPSFSYTNFKEEEKKIYHSGPILINLWASWCVPCLQELKAFNDNKESLEKAGLKIFALSVDGINGLDGNQEQALLMRNRINPYFETGMASINLINKIRILHNMIFEKRGNLVVPTSILIDSDGKLIAYYEGKVTPQKIINALKNSKEQYSQWASLPFSGRWLAEPIELRYSEYGNSLLDFEFYDDAIKLFDAKKWREQGQGVERFLFRLASSLEKNGNSKQAIRFYTHIANLRSKDTLAQIELGDKYAALGDSTNAVVYYKKALRLDPSQTEVRYNLAIMLNRLGKAELAITEFENVLSQNPKHTLALANSAAYYINKKNPYIAIIFLEKVLETKPDFHQARFQLAKIYELVDQKDDAIKEYQELIRLDPKNETALKQLKLLTKDNK